MGITSLLRGYFRLRSERTERWGEQIRGIQLRQLHRLLRRCRNTVYGRQYGFSEICAVEDKALYSAFTTSVPPVGYEEIRPLVERMLRGEKNVLWPGVCQDFAQSSGTSGGKSKFIPITSDSLRWNHYAGGADAVAHYLRLCPESRLFEGKGLILGGSFANELTCTAPGIRVGDLSATLIRRINPLANLVRIPDKRIALMADWKEKLPLLAAQAARSDVSNISGVPSWMLALLRRVMELRGENDLKKVWPHLEVFFHGGISFEPYRKEYSLLMPSANIHYLENYNASEGFFAVQNDFDDSAMLLLLDCGIFFEFAPLDGSTPLPAWEVKEGKIYELLISSCNGLWRYSPGDTVSVCSVSPLKIRVAGRTRSFINAFGEEVMEWNVEKAVAAATVATASAIADYTVAPIFSHQGTKARHQWFVEWTKKPASIEYFARILDRELQRVNSDYQAKRAGDIFLGLPEVISMVPGTFSRWLSMEGSGKLGGQRKIPRLSNDRRIADALQKLMGS